MSKFLINDESADETITLIRTKEQWDARTFSRAGYEREYNAYNHRIGRREYSGPIMRYSQEPYKFPCLAIEDGNTTYNPNGPDEYNITFIYDFEIVDE